MGNGMNGDGSTRGGKSSGTGVTLGDNDTLGMTGGNGASSLGRDEDG